jgi:hypothetical protein
VGRILLCVNSLLPFRIWRRESCGLSVDSLKTLLHWEQVWGNHILELRIFAWFMCRICLLCFFSQWLLRLFQHEQLAQYLESIWLPKLGSKTTYTVEEIYPGINGDHLVKLLYSQCVKASLGENAIGAFLEAQVSRTYFLGKQKSGLTCDSVSANMTLERKMS